MVCTASAGTTRFFLTTVENIRVLQEMHCSALQRRKHSLGKTTYQQAPSPKLHWSLEFVTTQNTEVIKNSRCHIWNVACFLRRSA